MESKKISLSDRLRATVTGAQLCTVNCSLMGETTSLTCCCISLCLADDGRVIKAVNKGSSSKIETVVIEDIRVFGPHDPVTDLKVFRDKFKSIEKLIVVSRDNVISIPLHRCGARKTCR